MYDVRGSIYLDEAITDGEDQRLESDSTYHNNVTNDFQLLPLQDVRRQGHCLAVGLHYLRRDLFGSRLAAAQYTDPGTRAGSSKRTPPARPFR